MLALMLAACDSGSYRSAIGGPGGPGEITEFLADVEPKNGCSAEGPIGGPFTVSGGSFVLRNLGAVPFPYAFGADQPWIQCSAPATGELAAGESLPFTVAVDAALVPTTSGAAATTNGTISIWAGSAGSQPTGNIPVRVNVQPVEGGWTRLTPSPDTRHVYVSSSGGNDANNGLSEQAAKASIQAAVALLRPGYPDWLHVRRGDQFSGGLGDWSRSGRSAVEPMVVTTYGPSANRPLFLCGTSEGLTVHGSSIWYVAFTGLHFFAHTHDGSNGQPYGVSLLAPCSNVLIEDCKIERFFTNLRIQGTATRDVKLRRCVVADAFTLTGGHAQGIYVDTINGGLIEECVFDHNGWRPSVPGADPTIFRHNIYLQGDTNNMVVRGNIIARGGSHGLQARSGGDVRNNLFLGNSINLLVGSDVQNAGSNSATVIGNVILDGRDINSSLRRGWATQFQCLSSGEIAYNVVAHQVTGTAPVSFNFDSGRGVGINNVDFHHNIAYRWGAPLTLAGNRYVNLVLRSNDVQEYGGAELIDTTWGGAVSGLLSGANRFFTTAVASRWMYYDNRLMSLPDWKAAVTDGTSLAHQVSYPRAHETIADYDRAAPHSGPGNLAAFLDEARLQSRNYWREKFVGTNAAAYFRSNFGVVVP